MHQGKIITNCCFVICRDTFNISATGRRANSCHLIRTSNVMTHCTVAFKFIIRIFAIVTSVITVTTRFLKYHPRHKVSPSLWKCIGPKRTLVWRSMHQQGQLPQTISCEFGAVFRAARCYVNQHMVLNNFSSRRQTLYLECQSHDNIRKQEQMHGGR